MKSLEKFEIKGNTVLAKFIRENLEELVSLKLNILNHEKGFIYLHPDGDFREGRNNEYGQRSVAGFGGYADNEYMAVKDLQNIINMEPYDYENPNLKKYLKS